jgi:hypothetical protein
VAEGEEKARYTQRLEGIIHIEKYQFSQPMSSKNRLYFGMFKKHRRQLRKISSAATQCNRKLQRIWQRRGESPARGSEPLFGVSTSGPAGLFAWAL